MTTSRLAMLASQRLDALRSAESATTAAALSPRERLVAETTAIMHVMAGRFNDEIITPWDTNWQTVTNRLAGALPIIKPADKRHQGEIAWRFVRQNGDPQQGARLLDISGHLSSSGYHSSERDACAQALDAVTNGRTFESLPDALMGVKAVKDPATGRYAYPQTALASNLSELAATSFLDHVTAKSPEFPGENVLGPYKTCGPRYDLYLDCLHGSTMFSERDPGAADRSLEAVWGVIEALPDDGPRDPRGVEAYLQAGLDEARNSTTFMCLGAAVDFLSREDVHFVTTWDEPAPGYELRK